MSYFYFLLNFFSRRYFQDVNKTAFLMQVSIDIEIPVKYKIEGISPNVIKLRNDEPSRYYCLDGIFICNSLYNA